ncbi:MAG: SET domain-containing protein-lysine N-methyltransferase [Patescibacteria group bacterium]
MEESPIIVFNQKNVYCGRSLKKYGGMAYFANHNFQAGDIVIHGFGKIIDHQAAHLSMEIGFKKHILPKKWTGRYLNHSCDPNCFAHTRSDGFPDIIALRGIKQGEEITYSYFMTELSWSSHVHEKRIPCLCGAKKCFGRILSFSQLTDKQKNNFKKRKVISSYLHNI